MKSAESAYRASCGDIDMRNELVMSELPHVYYIAARIGERLPKHIDVQDLVQAGVLGLLDACRNFNEAKDAQFSTFAKFRIRGAILDSLRRLDWGSRALRKRSREIAASIAKLEATLGRAPQEEEIAKDLGLSIEELHDAMAQIDALCIIGQQSESRNDRGDVQDLIESAPSPEDDNPFKMCADAETKAHLAQAIAKLPEREQLIISLYYREELTMKEIAEVVGVAVSRVSQIHSAVLMKLRASLAYLNEKKQSSKQSASELSRPSQALRHERQYERIA